MASHNPFLVNWVKGAYGMELGLVPMLEYQTLQVNGDSEFRMGLEQHLAKTRRHVQLLQNRLLQMGEDGKDVIPTEPVTRVIGHPNGGELDTVRQTELFDYVTEAFEVASYRGLAALADMLGDHETRQVCEQILADEIAISDVLHKRVGGHNGHKGGQEFRVQENIMFAHEVFAALNSHDLDRFDDLVADNYRAEIPGDVSPVDRVQNHARLESFFKAFPDMRYDIQRIGADGDTVFVDWTSTATHAGPLSGMDGQTIPPTNRTIKLDGVTVLSIKDGKLVHTRVVSDSGKMLQQLGVMPATEGTPTTSPSTSVTRGIVHLEIPAADREIAADFYNKMFGWEYEHFGEPLNYTTFKSGTVGGGFPNVSETAKAGDVVFYIYSDDIDADLRRAETLGARTITPRTEIPDYGQFAILADPTGNRVGLFYPS